ncbi:MAG: hypothetical protein FJW31_20160 [Acidobacteria bacterium]|nr:hypothetical protein [Acidobacteriota bacterium]
MNQSPLLAALAHGATLVTANARLAREWRQRYSTSQMEAGRAGWRTPAILPWGAFTAALAESETGATPLEPALTAAQEAALWEAIVEAGPDSSPLLDPSAAARLAADAWTIIHEWRVPLTCKAAKPAWEATAETSAFYGWAQQFQFHAQWAKRTSSARRADGLAGRTLKPAGSGEVWLAGFDEYTPRQREIIAALERGGTRVLHLADEDPAWPGQASLAAFASARDEAEAAAAWCRERLASNPDARTGVIVPGLESRRAVFDSAFTRAVPGAFHISLGVPLTERAAIAAALRMLEFGDERVAWSTVSAVLLSPWSRGFAEERGQRASFEVDLRRWRAAELTAAGLAHAKTCPPALSRAMWQVVSLVRSWPASQKPSEWSAAFAALLEAFGWPGDQTLTSAEYQVVSAWRGVLSELASTDLAWPSITRGRASALLRRLADGNRFEVESRGEPVQILGLFEAAGSRFDHLWIAGMDDETLPERPSPNPFVPLALQRRHALPHSSPARELAFATNVAGRLRRGAPEIVVSYVRGDGERELQPSPLFTDLPAWPDLAAAAVDVAPVGWDAFDDGAAPPADSSGTQRGGTRALELQAKCPFRAFAELRLHARELEEPELGFSPLERGGFLHKALELLARRFPSSASLMDASEDAVAECINAALTGRGAEGDRFTAKLYELERLRLRESLADWLALERKRAVPFTLAEPEEERLVTIGGLTVQVRLDRLDRLADGQYALIDYKTGQPKLKSWDGERPESPQVPLYAVTASEPLAAIAFAQVRRGDCRFRGYELQEDALPGAKLAKPEEFAERVETWRKTLTSLAAGFMAGLAPVDPKERYSTCAYCHLPALCRIEERKGA